MYCELLTDTIFVPYTKGAGPVFRLQTYDLNSRDSLGKWRLRYRLHMREGHREYLLFAGDDFSCSPMHGTDSPETTEAVMSFLCLRPGDTDPEYFESYTKEQMDFAEEHSEALACAVEHWKERQGRICHRCGSLRRNHHPDDSCVEDKT